jgi:hypothetical protein
MLIELMNNLVFNKNFLMLGMATCNYTCTLNIKILSTPWSYYGIEIINGNMSHAISKDFINIDEIPIKL